MKINLRLGTVALAAGIIGMAASLTAHAYIPPSFFIVKNIASKRAGFKGVRFRYQIVRGDGKTSTVKFKETATFDAATRVLRSRAYDDAGKLLYAAERRLPHAPLADSLLLEAGADHLVNALKAVGIPVRTETDLADLKDEEERYASETATMSRWKGSVAWVIGKAKSELWVEKDTFLPLRVVYSPKDSEARTDDIRFDSFRHFHELPFPRVITAVENPGETVILKADLIDVAINPDLAEFKQPLVTGFTDTGNAADLPTRELIQQYYQRIR